MVARACTIPLPGVTVDEDTGKALVDLWEDMLAPLQENAAYKALRVGWAAESMNAALQLVGARDAETFEARRLKQAVAGLPDQILTMLGSLAHTAKKASYDVRPRERFDDADAAAAAMEIGRAISDMTRLPGWEAFSAMLAMFAWAASWSLRHCKADDRAFYQGLRNEIVAFLMDVQSAIDRGEDAVAWLEEAAREAQKE